MSYYNEKIETMAPAEMKKLQGERLCALVKRAYDHVPYYRAKMERAGLTPADIRGMDDLYKLPFTTKQDLRDAYPYKGFAVPMSEVKRIHASSGTTGTATVVGYTAEDLDNWAESVARALVSVGASKEDIVHVSYGYGLFTGGLGLHDGADKLGCAVIPVSSGNTKRQLQILRDFRSTVIACTPSYALYLGDELAEAGIDPSELSLKYGIFGAEPWTDEMRDEIEQRLGLRAHNIYGLSEVAGPGVACECAERTGMHIQHDFYYPEIVDPETLENLPDGEYGELCFTCLNKQALPLIRYRTRDITKLTHETCACGRTTPRMERVTGRTDDMLIIRGVNVFPSQIEAVLLRVGGVLPHYMIYVDRKGELDTIEIKLEMTPELFSDSVKSIEALENRIKKELNSELLISCKVTLVEPKTLPRSEGKAVRVTDLRKLK